MSDSVHVSSVGAIVSTNSAYRRANFGGMYMTAEGKAFKSRIALAAKLAMGHRVPYTGPVSIEIGYWFKTAANDIDGPVKLTVDALQGIVFKNDRQVVHLAVDKYRALDPEHVGVALTVRPVENAEGAE